MPSSYSIPMTFILHELPYVFLSISKQLCTVSFFLMILDFPPITLTILMFNLGATMQLIKMVLAILFFAITKYSYSRPFFLIILTDIPFEYLIVTFMFYLFLFVLQPCLYGSKFGLEKEFGVRSVGNFEEGMINEWQSVVSGLSKHALDLYHLL
jgi:hypothetical protein